MYLSQLTLNPRSRQVRSELARAYELHRTVMSGFITSFADERVLYRLEQSARDGIPRLLVQSRFAPDWSRLQAQPGYLLVLPDGNPQVREFDPRFSPGQHLVFRLLANPTRSIKTDGVHAAQDESGRRLRGKRLYISDPAEQAAWLAGKSAGGGFHICALRINNRGEQHVAVPDEHDHIQPARHWAVCFDGELEVTHPDIFRQILENGIGSAKGFGYGLLTVATP
jgi:CRISPR system Cascade subunit CasE